MKPETNKLLGKAATRSTALILLSVMTLWAWNTVAIPLGAQPAQFKHIVAAAILVFIGRWIVLGRPAKRIPGNTPTQS